MLPLCLVKTEGFVPETVAEELKTDDLYFVRAGPFVKVGRTSNLEARLVSIQTGCPFAIDSALSFSGMGKLEKELHLDLRDCRANGEWFHWGEQPERQLNEMRRRAFVWQQARDFLEERAASECAHPQSS
jgi:hypothetical protein